MEIKLSCKDERSIKKNYCIDCGKEITGKKYCQKCYFAFVKTFGLNHKYNCQCASCLTKRGKLKHKEGCQCCSCKAKRGDYKGKNHPMYGKKRIITEEQRRNSSINNACYWKGKCFSEEHKIKLSLAKVNYVPWIKGKQHTKESKKQMSLSHGGTGITGELSEYGAEFDNTKREQVRFRDHYKCRMCGGSQIENEKQLDIHHKDYDKKNNKWNNFKRKKYKWSNVIRIRCFSKLS